MFKFSRLVFIVLIAVFLSFGVSVTVKADDTDAPVKEKKRNWSLGSKLKGMKKRIEKGGSSKASDEYDHSREETNKTVDNYLEERASEPAEEVAGESSDGEEKSRGIGGFFRGVRNRVEKGGNKDFKRKAPRKVVTKTKEAEVEDGRRKCDFTETIKDLRKGKDRECYYISKKKGKRNFSLRERLSDIKATVEKGGSKVKGAVGRGSSDFKATIEKGGSDTPGSSAGSATTEEGGPKLTEDGRREITLGQWFGGFSDRVERGGSKDSEELIAKKKEDREIDKILRDEQRALAKKKDKERREENAKEKERKRLAKIKEAESAEEASEEVAVKKRREIKSMGAWFGDLGKKLEEGGKDSFSEEEEIE